MACSGKVGEKFGLDISKDVDWHSRPVQHYFYLLYTYVKYKFRNIYYLFELRYITFHLGTNIY